MKKVLHIFLFLFLISLVSASSFECYDSGYVRCGDTSICGSTSGWCYNMLYNTDVSCGSNNVCCYEKEHILVDDSGICCPPNYPVYLPAQNLCGKTIIDNPEDPPEPPIDTGSCEEGLRVCDSVGDVWFCNQGFGDIEDCEKGCVDGECVGTFRAFWNRLISFFRNLFGGTGSFNPSTISASYGGSA